jgi:Arc/MetJ family transcription regulator
VYVGRTNIDLDDEKVARVMRAYGLRTKREAVALAIDRLLDDEARVGGMLELCGTGWDGDLDEVRGPPAS